MCYSAQAWQAYDKYVRVYGADVSFLEFVRLYGLRNEDARIRIPKAMDAAFANPKSADEQRIKALIDSFNQQQMTKFEQDLFKQRKRLADAERTLKGKTTKNALNDQRIAGEKVGWLLGKIADVKRSETKDRDARIFPGWYAPLMVIENGRRVLKPMRYQCRLAGKPAYYDTRFPGTYNARRDNLEGFWKDQFGTSHGIMVVNAFYENVSRHKLEGRALADGEKDQNVVLEFRPRPQHDMLVACLWSRWQTPGEPDLLSFAAITDEPPAEVAAAGHDRCIIPIKPENIDAWLTPDPANRVALQAILDDRDRPYYEHRIAA